MSQLPLTKWAMRVAEAVSIRSSCVRGRVGCVILNHRGKIKATGYNAPPTGLPHCIDQHCLGADKVKYPDSCISVHAEISALMQCADIEDVGIVVVTLAPCFRCSKALLNTSMYKLVYNGDLLPECEELFNMASIELEQLK